MHRARLLFSRNTFLSHFLPTRSFHTTTTMFSFLSRGAKINEGWEDFFKQPTKDYLRENVATKARDMALKQWDAGVFSTELRDLKLTPKTLKSDPQARPIKEGTYSGTQLALTELFDRIERSYSSYFHCLRIEQLLPEPLSLETKKQMYRWDYTTYPAHLKHIPENASTPEYKIFNVLGLVETALLLPKVVPDTIIGTVVDDIRGWIFGDPEMGATMSKLEALNRENRKSGTDIMKGANIGDLSDWYSDARFAQQAFTGNNPTTITKASEKWLADFTAEAKRQNSKITARLTAPKPNAFYVQDASFIREAVGGQPKDTLCDGEGDQQRWQCSSVTLFELHDDGKLHPLAVLIDWKGSMADSVTIFNEQRPTPSSDMHREASDWAWRYAKTCSQSSDWLRHEVAAHLVNTHFVEEVTIVAANRTLPEDHCVFRLLDPHWYKTLSLNAAARSTLVPNIIIDLVGLTEAQAYKYIDYTFKNFDFVQNYVPNDLKNRGFPLDDVLSSDHAKSERYKNYAYARNVGSLWYAIRRFINSLVALEYPNDTAVEADQPIKDWCKEVQTAGRIPTFPSIKTVSELVDAVTMCIHIAAVQHTAVNYLQNFYQAFVVNKPPALFSAPPTSIDSLRNFKEQDLIQALPTGIDRQRYWLLSAQVPWLLSFRAPEDNTLLNYALSGYKLYKYKEENNGQKVKQTFDAFYDDLRRLADEFVDTSKNISSGSTPEIPYTVVEPTNAAVSILI